VEGIIVIDAVDFDEDVAVLHGWDLVVIIVVDAVGLLLLHGSEAAVSFACMAFDGLLRLGEILCDCGCGEAGSRHELSVLDGLIPGGLCGETSCHVVVLYKLWLHLQLVNAVDGFRWWGVLG
jgi:hypothetical protein